MAGITCVIGKGGISMLYSEKIKLDGFGDVQSIKRWSEIEFNAEIMKWEVRRVGSAEVLFADVSREVCVEFEHGYFNQLAKEGKL